ncbi:hypothetical protein XELAEV_18032574mg [Xenopus laevis]|uniref:Uncharacterized protein n=1 Tax=Xenopus laevis TaxID=8355 RepID=A0A974CHY6_XENLA|nr:hypothetical protein XELAEV_18032574mg [Xenopus laevis]
MYQTIEAKKEKQVLNCYKTWLQDIGELDPDKWMEVLRHLTKSTIASRDKLIQVKFLHCSYLTPECLNRLTPTRGLNCTSRRGHPGSWIYIVWSCPKLVAYWIQIFAFISKLLVLTIPPDPALALLDLTRGLVNSAESRTLLQLLL